MDRPHPLRFLITLAGSTSLLALSTPAFAAPAGITLTQGGISIEKENFGQITLSYPHLLAGKSERKIVETMLNGDTADVNYADQGSVHVEVQPGQILFTFTNIADDVTDTRINAELGFTNLMGGTWAIGKKSGTFPGTAPADPYLYKGDAANFAITSPDGGTVSLKLPGVGWQQLQDNRQWGTNAFVWQYKYFYDKGKASYAIQVEEGVAAPAPAASAASAAPASSAAPAAKGPTPYPPAKDKSWPGKGVIRGPGFAWVAGERAAFWKNREKDQGAIVFAGDSLTGGWKSLAKEFPNFKVANRGVGGDVSRGLLFRFKEDVLSVNPRAVVIEIGNNDLTALDKTGSAASNIADMIDLVAAHDPKVPVIVCTIPPSDKDDAPIDPAVRNALNEAIKKLPQSKDNVYLCDLAAAVSNPDGTMNPIYYQKDKIHLAGAGHKKWAETITPLLEQLKLAGTQ